MEEQRIGVYICWCGTNIALMVDVEKVAEEVGKLPNVVVSKNYKYMCSDPGQDLIIKDIKENNLNRVVVAACSPRIHELTFRKALQNAGINPYLFEMTNIREQDSWVHINREAATAKAKALITASIKRVAFHDPLDKRSVDINPATLILGGGIAGLSAALEIADAGKKVYLIEKSEKLGGNAINIDLSFPYLMSVQQMIKHKIKRATTHPNIEVYLNTDIDNVFGYIGNFETDFTYNKKEVKLNFGNVIVATGLKPYDASKVTEYGYGKFPEVVTSIEFEKMLVEGKIENKDGTIPENIAIIHCAGSRNTNHHDYCSRVCCNTALKFTNQIRSALPDSNVFDIYADMRSYSKGCEELYAKTSRKEVMFLMFDQQDKLPLIRQATPADRCKLLIEFKEQISGKEIEVPADMVVLMIGMEAHEEAKKIAHAVGISMDGNGFYIERHPKLDPVATTTDGVYIVGSCQAPKDIVESVTQAKAAAARILGTIIRGSVEVEVTTAVVNEEICCGCQTCISVCPYTAISFKIDEKVSYVNEVLCKGCGTCGSACPTGAIRSRHFTDQQILAQIEGLMLVES
jgi:heterodisulfide reductase subunit A2